MILQTEPFFFPPDAWRFQVYLDGNRLARCIYADEEAGIARIRGETDEIVELHGEVRIERWQ